MGTQTKKAEPNFIVGGALKGGSTAVFHYLKQHPQIFVAEEKELRYLGYDKNDPWCQAHPEAFPITTLEDYLNAFAGVQDEIAIGEASPAYMASPFAAQRTKELFPHVKLIFSVRNPIDSAYSSYQMDVRAKREDRPVEEAFGSEERRVERYRYYHYLKNWYDLFPADQIKVILFDDVIKNPVPTMQELYRFLKVDETFVPNPKAIEKNSGGLPKNALAGHFYHVANNLRRVEFLQKAKTLLPSSVTKTYKAARNASLEKAPSLPEEIRADLRNYYAEDVHNLGELTGVEVSKWKIVD